jgi:hypothetical protein
MLPSAASSLLLWYGASRGVTRRAAAGASAPCGARSRRLSPYRRRRRSSVSSARADPPPGAGRPGAAPRAWPTRRRSGPTGSIPASTSTALRCRSWTSASVSASAWAAARGERPSVSYLWPVTSSAVLRQPRRRTTSRLRATSVAGVCRRNRGVPHVRPRGWSQPWHAQRGWPERVRPLPVTCPAPHHGQGGWSGDGRRTTGDPLLACHRRALPIPWGVTTRLLALQAMGRGGFPGDAAR